MAQLNRRFAKLVDGKLEYSPRVFHETGNVVVPKATDVAFYLTRGWLEVVDELPEYDAAESYPVQAGWEEDAENGKIRAIYELKTVEAPRTATIVKKYSKLKITLFCMEAGIWDSVKSYLEGIGYYDLFVMAQYFLESDKYFTKGVEQFVDAFRGSVDGIDEMVEKMKAFAEDGTAEIDPETGAEV